MTTSEGRYYRRVQFRRLVGLVQSHYRKNNIKITRRKIRENLLEKTAQRHHNFVKSVQAGSIDNGNKYSNRISHFEQAYKN